MEILMVLPMSLLTAPTLSGMDNNVWTAIFPITGIMILWPVKPAHPDNTTMLMIRSAWPVKTMRSLISQTTDVFWTLTSITTTMAITMATTMAIATIAMVMGTAHQHLHSGTVNNVWLVTCPTTGTTILLGVNPVPKANTMMSARGDVLPAPRASSSTSPSTNASDLIANLLFIIS